MNFLYKLLSLLVPFGGIVFLCILFYGKFIPNRDVIPHSFCIEVKSQLLDANDSLDANVLQLQQLLTELKHQEQVIDEKYTLLIQSKERESNTIEYLSIIVAILLAIASFYGVKTFNDIEEKAQKMAEAKVKEDMPKIAKAVTNKEVRAILEKSLDDLGITKIKNDIKTELIADFMEDFEERFSSLENSREIIAEGITREENIESKDENETSRSQEELEKMQAMLANPASINPNQSLESIHIIF